jgi:hypothetical protein
MGPYFFVGFRIVDGYFGAAHHVPWRLFLKKTAVAQFVFVSSVSGAALYLHGDI